MSLHDTTWWKTVLKIGSTCRYCGRRQVRGEVALFRAEPKAVMCLGCQRDRGTPFAESRAYRRAVAQAAERRGREAAL